MLGFAGVVVLLALAVFLAVLAIDVLRWRGHLERADVALASGQGESALRDPAMRLPSGLSHRLLDVDDDVAFRRAVERFRQSNPRRPPRDQREASLRSRAETELARIGRNESNTARRSLLSTLRGVLALEDARAQFARFQQRQGGVFVRRSLASFREAVRLDESNQDAKFNLELVLGLLRSAQTGDGNGEGGTRRGDPVASGAGAASAGSGY
jgi:hypothetical protein